MQLTEHTYFGEGSRYYLEKLLGRGGFSEVWLVKDTLTDTEEALKVYAPGTGMDDDGLHIFTKELNVVQNIHHPNLLTSSYVGVWQNMPYLVMPYCPQGSLVKRIGHVTEDEAWAILSDVATGLDYLHSQPSPIIHQDIKPDNILVDALGHYVITDFGISARAQSTLRKSVRNAADGTTDYMGPERFGPDPLPIKASDIWALGATIFELIEGYTPFGNLGGLSQKSGADIPVMKAPVSDKLKRTIYCMLAKEPWNRPQAAELAKGRSFYASHGQLFSELNGRTNNASDAVEAGATSDSVDQTNRNRPPHKGSTNNIRTEREARIVKERPNEGRKKRIWMYICLAVVTFAGVAAFLLKETASTTTFLSDSTYSYKMSSGVTLTMPGDLSYSNINNGLLTFSNSTIGVTLYASCSTKYSSVSDAYNKVLDSVSSKRVTYQVLNTRKNFAVVSWWDGNLGHYFRAEYRVNRVHIWHLTWEKSAHDTWAKPAIDGGRIKYRN